MSAAAIVDMPRSDNAGVQPLPLIDPKQAQLAQMFPEVRVRCQT